MWTCSQINLKSVKHRDGKKYTDVAYNGLYDQNKIQEYNLNSMSFHKKIHTVLG